MKIFLDANTIISAFIFKDGAVGHFMRLVAVRRGYDLFTSKEVLGEVYRVVKRNKKWTGKEVFIDEFIKVFGIEVLNKNLDVKSLDEVDIRDPNDRHVVVAALKVGADVLVTGDKDFFDRDLGIKVMTAADFIKKFG